MKNCASDTHYHVSEDNPVILDAYGWPHVSLPNYRLPPVDKGTMAGSSKVADILHKTVTGGLVLVTAFALADVTRGFGVLVKRNIDRRAAAVEQEQNDDRKD